MADQDQQFRFAADSLVKQDPDAQKVMTQRSAQLAAVQAVLARALGVSSVTLLAEGR